MPSIRFQQFLETIHTYLDQRDTYKETLDLFKKELYEEESLHNILENYDDHEFENLKKTIVDFINQYRNEIEDLHNHLDELSTKLQIIIHKNNHLLERKRHSDTNFDLFYNKYQSDIQQVHREAISIGPKINQIYQLLKDQDRLGQNHLDSSQSFVSQTTRYPKSNILIPQVQFPLILNENTSFDHKKLFKQDNLHLESFHVKLDFTWKSNQNKALGNLISLVFLSRDEQETILEISATSNHYGKDCLYLYYKRKQKTLGYGILIEKTGSSRYHETRYKLIIHRDKKQLQLSIQNICGSNQSNIIPLAKPILYKGDRYDFEEWITKKSLETPAQLSYIDIGTPRALPSTINHLHIS